ncbi:MAG: acyl-CoA dehydrogenase [bacterium]
MDFLDSPEEAAFRGELRAWLATNMPPGWTEGELLEKVVQFDERVRFLQGWQRKLFEAGWAGIAWPKEYGGRGATVMQQVIFNEEIARQRAPEIINVIGINMVGPTIIAHGTEEQKKRFLPKILSCEEIWAQGYSEPNSGSDLASLKTRAEVRDDGFVVNGQKVWTTLGPYAHWIMLLARTDPASERHSGISCLLVDLASPGVTVRPLVQITGEAEFGEVFFDNVHVPRENLLGRLGGGWETAMTTLLHERGTLAISVQVRLELTLAAVIELARRVKVRGKPALEDGSIRQELARCYSEVQIMRWNSYRSLTKIARDGIPGPEGSFGKLFWTDLSQRMTELAVNLAGPAGLIPHGNPGAVDQGRWIYGFLRARANTIEAGTSEIQRNIVGERVLGLPKG